ncbi:alcohol dehydrogenase [Desulfoluna limicola]|uniref:Alcohol dehydrogenase n=1 Tax=Desulfoluna limicola TaxID=2810562 RepID=A0ABM7PN61_9BACT|nr:YhdH/YhfP family quinone oxidoreductase [Desulfoluna limicola]BCS98708.1 alcohol dehydrogenase [Desulfoluna limicola]
MEHTSWENVTYHAMVVSEEEGAFVRNIETLTLKDLPEGDVLIRVGFSSLNWKDCLSAMGNPGVTRRYPHTPGIDAAGIVAECTTGAFHKGDKVIVTGYDLGMNTAGGFAEFIRVPEEWVVRLPRGLTRKEAMMLGTAGFTAGLSVKRLVDLGVTPEMGTVLVTGATGGVGSLAVLILKKLGFTVAAVSGREERRDYLTAIGVDQVVPLDDAVDKSGKPLGKQLWAGVVDAVGGEVLETAIKNTRNRGVVTCCGNVRSGDLNSSIYPFILRGVSLCGIDSATCPMDERLAVWAKLAMDWKPDDLAEVVESLNGLEDLDEQMERMVKGERTGRCVVHIP